MKKTLLMLFPIAILFSCTRKDENKTSIIKTDTIIKDPNPYIVNYENKERMKKMLDSAIINADTLSYQQAFKDFIVSEHSQEFLYYSIKMAKRNNYPRAYFDTYTILNILDKRNGYLSQSDKNEALFYLLKAYEKGDINAKYKLDELYTKKNNKIPLSSSVLNNK
jgi:TPR repeat protein